MRLIFHNSRNFLSHREVKARIYEFAVSIIHYILARRRFRLKSGSLIWRKRCSRATVLVHKELGVLKNEGRLPEFGGRFQQRAEKVNIILLDGYLARAAVPRCLYRLR
ncbi:hypothetical protein ACLB2K_035308 [Fragaria x ananassa]